MRRRLLTVASVVNLLLCVATAALWVRSYWWQYSLFHVGHAHQGDQTTPKYPSRTACSGCAMWPDLCSRAVSQTSTVRSPGLICGMLVGTSITCRCEILHFPSIRFGHSGFAETTRVAWAV